MIIGILHMTYTTFSIKNVENSVESFESSFQNVENCVENVENSFKMWGFWGQVLVLKGLKSC